MLGDRPRRFERIGISSIHYQLSLRHYRPLKGAGFVELPESVDVPELAEPLARIILEPNLELGVGATELHEMEITRASLNALLKRRDEIVGDSRLRRESHDNSRLLRDETRIDGTEPQLFTEGDEVWRPEGKERSHQVDNRVVVEKTVPRFDREQLTDGELADSGTAEEEDDLGSHASKIRLPRFRGKC